MESRWVLILASKERDNSICSMHSAVYKVCTVQIDRSTSRLCCCYASLHCYSYQHIGYRFTKRYYKNKLSKMSDIIYFNNHHRCKWRNMLNNTLFTQKHNKSAAFYSTSSSSLHLFCFYCKVCVSQYNTGIIIQVFTRLLIFFLPICHT